MRGTILLGLLGLIGVLSLLLVPFEQLMPIPIDPATARLLVLVQPTILLLVSLTIGSRLAPKLGLAAPATAALAERRSPLPILRSQLEPALTVGLPVAVLLLGYAMLVQQQAPPLAAQLPESPLAMRLLYGGITEEIIARWGIMSLFAWVAWRLTGGGAKPRPAAFWIGNAIAAALFAAGHLPLLFASLAAPPTWLVLLTLVANVLPGLAFGWLFWRHGLESAMLAHGMAHLANWVIAAAIAAI